MSPSQPSAGTFRSLLDAFAHLRVPLPEGGTPLADPADTAARLRRELRAAIHEHAGNDRWRELMQRMREAAEDGAHEYRLLRFPTTDCTDGGRAIRQHEPAWSATLTGEAAELYRHWEQELQPLGFRIVARALEDVGGLPGDIGLFITWS